MAPCPNTVLFQPIVHVTEIPEWPSLASLADYAHHLPHSSSHTILLLVFISTSYSLFTHPPIALTIGRVEPIRMGSIRPHPHQLFALESGRRSSDIEPYSFHTPHTYYHSQLPVYRAREYYTRRIGKTFFVCYSP